MNNRTSVQRNGKKHSWFGLLATVLSFVLIVLIGIAVRLSAPQRYDYHAEPSMILGDLKRGRYAEAVIEVAENRAMGVDERTNADYASPYAVCDYFEAYSYYVAYLRAGDEVRAAEYEEQMQSVYDKMGTLQFMAEDIRKALE